MNHKNVAIIAARRAGKALLKLYDKKIFFERKGQLDLVTEADKTAESIIIKEIKKHFPEHDIIGEESGKTKNGSEYLWTIDPLDGTNNFLKKVPYWCTSIALLKNNEPILGVIFDPFHNELFVAKKGKGATLNKKPIFVSQTTQLSDAIVSYEQGHLMDQRSFFAVLPINKKIRALRIMGSTALNLANVAAGRFDAFISRNITYWDLAAGIVIVKEANGKVATIEGKSWSFSEKSIVASNGRLKL
ncbi:MAG: inositol monophosphatase family protein [Candidatus Woesearchaeota archaeon]